MPTTTIPRDLLDPRCVGCQAPIAARTPIVNFGDMQFHPDCRPACATCGRVLRPGESGWRSEGRVVSEPWGYSVRPTAFWCPECLSGVPRDEPRSSF